MTESRNRLPARLRKIVENRAKGVCEYCLSPARYSSSPFCVDHILPRNQGGGDELGNLAFSCSGCNGHKYRKTEALDPRTRSVVPLFHPRTQEWTEHFAWNRDFTRIMGLTPMGRATVGALQLNRSEVVNLRRMLTAFGEHPPS